MQNLTPEEKIRLNSIFGDAAFAVTIGDPDELFDLPKELVAVRSSTNRLDKQGATESAIQMAYDVLRECIEARTIDPIDAIKEAIDCLEGVVKH